MSGVRLVGACAMSLVACAEPPCAHIDPSLDAARCDSVLAMRIDALPPARGNAYGDDAAAAELGFFNFFDVRFSRSGTVRCATCHIPEYAFQDKRTVSVGEGTGRRNSPSILNAARHTRFFWDGRADALWAQSLFAIESEVELGSTRLELAHLVVRAPDIARGYERVFGSLPDLSDPARFPSRGMPGDAAFDAMTEADRETVNRIAVNVGKAFEAYMRRATSGPSRLDAFLEGDQTALEIEEREGLIVFVRAGCTSCHGGPLLSDELFHDVGFPVGEGPAEDLGGAEGVRVLATSPFTLTGTFADDVALPPPRAPEDEALFVHRFRTPSLRSVTRTAPYGHDGSFPTLASVLAFHAASLSEHDRGKLIRFFSALEGRVPERPFGFWPQRARP